jgi:hypothetical protein
LAAAPDELYVPGEYSHLVVGQAARLTDARRTPLTVTAVDHELAMFDVRVEAFEDIGSVWRLPAADVSRLQFPRDGRTLPASTVRRLQSVDARLNRIHPIRRASARTAAATESAIVDASRRATSFLLNDGPQQLLSLPTRNRVGTARLHRALRRFLADSKIAGLDEEIARAWASNPSGYETIKAHLIVMAQMGLLAYRGSALRDESLLRGVRAEAARRTHVTERLGFVRAMFEVAGTSHVTLWRGSAFTGHDTRPAGLVSTTFSPTVARSNFASRRPGQVGAALYRVEVPIRRLFMTYIDTPELSSRGRKAEAVVLRGELFPI